MHTAQLLERIVKKPSAADLLKLQCVLLSTEEGADSRGKRERSVSALGLLGDFYSYLVALESKLDAHDYAELASRMDMGAVGGVVAENVLGSGDKLLERILVGGLSEALTVLASRQYVKAFNRELDAFYQQVAWQLRAHLWRFSAAKRPDLAPVDRAALIDSLFAPIYRKDTPAAAKPILLGCLFQILLLSHIAPMLQP